MVFTFIDHQFSYKKVDNIGPIKAMKNRLKVEKPYSGGKVGRFDKEGNLLETFETMTDCVKAGYKTQNQSPQANVMFAKVLYLNIQIKIQSDLIGNYKLT